MMSHTYTHPSALTAVRVARELRGVGWHSEVTALRTGEWLITYWEKKHERSIDAADTRLESIERHLASVE